MFGPRLDSLSSLLLVSALPVPHPAASLKVIGLEVSPWGVVALSLSHVGSEAFYTQQKGTQWPRCAQKAITLVAGAVTTMKSFSFFVFLLLLF